MKPGAPMAERGAISVRTSVVLDGDRWMVRVQVEQGVTKLPLFVGPFGDQADAENNGHKIAKLVREAFYGGADG